MKGSPQAGPQASSIQPPHAPEVGKIRRWLGAFHVTGSFWYRFHGYGVRYLPDPVLAGCMVLFTGFFFLTLFRIRRAIAANLEAVLGPCGWLRRQVRIYRTMWHFGWCLTERYERLGTDRGATMTAGDERRWLEAQASPEGLVLVTAHVGHWEIGSMAVPDRHVHVVREEEMDPEAQAFLDRLFARPRGSAARSGRRYAGFTLHFAAGDPTLGPRLLGALRRGEFVALQGDRPRASGRSVAVELFGRPFALPAGPAALARAAGVAMLPVFVFRRGRRQSQAVFRPPIRVASGRDGLERAVRQIAAEIEWAIRAEPHQWFCFRELWPEETRR